MLGPQQLLRIIIEMIFVLLGGLIVWLGVSGRIFFDRRSATWLILSAALVLWGIRAMYRPEKWWSRWEQWTRGASLTLLGVVMLALSRVPFAWVRPLFVFAGVILVLRGLAASLLVLRPR
jgi:multisubunit Na+/H+ antiporter MnhG subunit